MNVAFAGKGGVGKTTLAATVARLFARSGLSVVAVDADSNPNLAPALGADGESSRRLSALPAGIVSRRLGGPALNVSVGEVLERHGVEASDGVRLVSMGAPRHAEEGCLCAGHAAVSALLEDTRRRPASAVVVDLEASPEHLSRGTVRHADVLVVVSEPYYRSLESMNRIASLASELPIPHVVAVLNKCRGEEDREAFVEFCERHSLRFFAALAWSEEAVRADRCAMALLDYAPGGEMVTAVAGLADAILELHGRAGGSSPA